MLSLIWKIGADTNPFRQAIKQVPDEAKKIGKEAGDVFGREMGQQFKSMIMGAIGFGALKSMVSKAVEESKAAIENSMKLGTSVETAQQIKRVADVTGMSVEDVRSGMQMNPEKFKALAANATRRNPILSKEAVEALAETQEFASGFGTQIGELAAVPGRFERMTSVNLKRFGMQSAYSGMGATPFSSRLASVAMAAQAGPSESLVSERLRLKQEFGPSVAAGKYMEENGEKMLQVLRLIHEKL